MTDLSFEVLDVSVESYAASPQLKARVRITERSREVVHAMVLRCQVRIEPERRRHSPLEEEGLRSVFGDRDRWSATMGPLLWMHSNTTVQGFTGSTEVNLPLPCSYDFDVTGSRYLHALEDNEVPVPLILMFSGMVFTRGRSGFGVEQVSWDREAGYDMPVKVWRRMMDLYYPSMGWIRLDRRVLDDLAKYRAQNGFVSWDETVEALIDLQRGVRLAE